MCMCTRVAQWRSLCVSRYIARVVGLFVSFYSNAFENLSKPCKGGDLFLFTHLTVERCPFLFIYLGEMEWSGPRF